MELRRYWQILLKRRGTLAKIVLIIVGTVILGSFLISPVYQFNAKVLVRTNDPKAVVSGLPIDLVNLGSVSTDLVMYSQLAMIKNLPMIQDVIAKMHLEKKKDSPYIANEFLEPGTTKLLTQKKGVKVSQLASTQIIQVSGFSSSPEEAAEIANQVSDAFVTMYNQNNQTAAQQSLRFIRDNLPIVSARLQEAEDALADYKMANHLSNITYLREKLISNLVTQQATIDDNKTELVNLKKHIAATNEKLKKIPKFNRTTQEYRSNNTLEYIRGKLMDAEANMASGGVRAKGEYFSQKQQQATIEKLKEKYEKQAAMVFYSETTDKNSLHTSLVKDLIDSDVNLVVRTARKQVADQIFRDRQKELDDLNVKEITLGSLLRKVTALQTSHTNLLTQEQTAILASRADLSNASVIERAVVPADASYVKDFRWFPKRKLLAIFSFVFGLLLGLLTILSQEYLDNTLADPVETEGYLHFPVLATLPDLPPTQVADLPRLMAHAPWTQAIWALPDMLKPAGAESLAGILAVSSSSAGEGKSLVAASLGWVLALRGLKVLLIDLNFFHPSLPSLWRLPPGPGVGEILQGTASLTDCLRKVRPGELYLLPNGKADEVVWPQLDPKILADWLTTVKTGFDVLLLDLPAVAAGEGASLTALADQTLMVVAADHTPRDQAARALEQILRCHGRIAGLVFNRYRKLELYPLLAPTVEAINSWPPVQRLSTFVGKHLGSQARKQ